MAITSNEIRQTFLDFFQNKGHHIVPSAPLVMKNDPTLMFTNAGMNQFKDIFLGNKKAEHPRIADTQKCLRVSGKHNDLEDVGLDTYHHTMFEMLGNWSFGDYFKKEAIEWAWELLTEVYKIPKDRLYVTIFEGDKSEKLEQDNEAYNEWTKWIDKDKIINGNKKDNFWEMGDTGPCGPCSEIHVDIRSDAERKKVNGKDLVNKGNPLVIEIWNLVFIQYNRKSDGNLEPLPAKHVDTGMGFERLCMVLQGKQSNYDTDVFTPLIKEIEKLSEKKYSQTSDATASSGGIAMRVLADHIRAVSFCIADGQLPSNTGAGYVIRRILRRAVRYTYSYLGMEKPLLNELVFVLAEQMKNVFPEMHTQKDFVKKVILEEENNFLRTLSDGITRFGAYTNLETARNLLDVKGIKKKTKGDNVIDGKFAFQLYDTFGFPIDLTQLMASEVGWTVDMKGFESEMQKQKSRSRKATTVETSDWHSFSGSEDSNDNKKNKQYFKEEEKHVMEDRRWREEIESGFVGYDTLETKSQILKYRKIKTKDKELHQIVLDKTPFYAESGGQVGDTGILELEGEKIKIIDTKKENDLIIHFAENLPSSISHLPSFIIAKVDVKKRKLTANNHSATHLLHAALRKVLGKHVQQKGSLVHPDYFRFDFSHFQKVTDEELEKIEQMVNEKIRENIPQQTEIMPIKKAMETGAMALFGEKYGEQVRVVTFDKNYSIELCGGTHVKSTGQIGYFKITFETAVAAGVRRIEAVTSVKAEEYINEKLKKIQEISDLLKNPKDVIGGVKNLLEENSRQKKELESLTNKQANVIKEQLKNKIQKINGVNFIGEIVEINSADVLKDICFNLRNEVEPQNFVALLGANINGKPNLALIISDDLVKENRDAGKIIREIAKEIQGGGGGQPFFATAGGNNLAGLAKAIVKVKEIISK